MVFSPICGPLGHLLGLSHDDSKFCEERFGSNEDKRLMSSILTSIDASKPWSRCTSSTITDFFDDGHGEQEGKSGEERLELYWDQGGGSGTVQQAIQKNTMQHFYLALINIAVVLLWNSGFKLWLGYHPLAQMQLLNF